MSEDLEAKGRFWRPAFLLRGGALKVCGNQRRKRLDSEASFIFFDQPL